MRKIFKLKRILLFVNAQGDESGEGREKRSLAVHSIVHRRRSERKHWKKITPKAEDEEIATADREGCGGKGGWCTVWE